jgi:general stress protein 26
MPLSTETMEKIIDNCRTSIISSIDADGFPNTKAMLPPRKRTGLKEFYFSTNTSSQRVLQYKANRKACLYFFDPNKFLGIMIVGQMEVKLDQETKNDIWREGDTMYYPLGITDPDYCVLKFTGTRIRTYHDFQKDDILI